MAFPRMISVRQSFPRARAEDIPAAVRQALSQISLPIKPGDRVAVGAGRERDGLNRPETAS